MPSPAPGAVDAVSGDPVVNPSLAQGTAAAAQIIGLIGVALRRRPAGPASTFQLAVRRRSTRRGHTIRNSPPTPPFQVWSGTLNAQSKLQLGPLPCALTRLLKASGLWSAMSQSSSIHAEYPQASGCEPLYYCYTRYRSSGSGAAKSRRHIIGRRRDRNGKSM